jgi:hypothetical protein
MCRVASARRVSLGVRLLADLRTVFGDAKALHTETILKRLHSGVEYGLDADAPWGNLHGQPLGDRRLASMLGRYQARSGKLTIDGRSLQGYRREHLWDAWVRYLPSLNTAETELPELNAPGSPQVLEVPQVPAMQPCGSEIADHDDEEII